MELGLGELIFIFILALLLFGPKKLPQISRQVADALNQFKRASNDFKSQLESEVQKFESEVDFKGTILNPAQGVIEALKQGAMDMIVTPVTKATTDLDWTQNPVSGAKASYAHLDAAIPGAEAPSPATVETAAGETIHTMSDHVLQSHPEETPAASEAAQTTPAKGTNA